MNPTKNAPLEKKYVKPKLYYGDLLEIESVLKKSFGDVKITIEYVDDKVPYQGDTLKDLTTTERRKDLSYLRMSVSDKIPGSSYSTTDLVLKAGPYGGLELTADDPTDKIAGVFVKVDMYVSKRERRYLGVIGKVLDSGSYLAAPVAIGLMYYAASTGDKAVVLALSIVAVVVLLVFLVVPLWRLAKPSKSLATVSLEDKPGALMSRRNMQKLSYDLLLLVIGALVGGFVTKWFF